MTGPIIAKLDDVSWIAARNWVRNLLAVFISSGATAAYAWVGVALGHAVDEGIPVLNWKVLLSVFCGRGFVKCLELLGVNPLPGVTMNTNGSVKSYSAANSAAATTISKP